MTYKPIPEHRRRELATHVPELTRKFRFWLGATVTGESENDFWQRLAPGVSPNELVWLIRQARSAAGCIDPVLITSYPWPARCNFTGSRATRERWPLEPIPGEPQAQPTLEGLTYVKPATNETRRPKAEPLLGAPYGPGVVTANHRMETERRILGHTELQDLLWEDIGRFYAEQMTARVVPQTSNKPVVFEGAIHDELNFSLPRGVDLSVALETLRPWHTFIRPSQFFDCALYSTSTKEKHAMNQTAQQATPTNAHVLTVDTSNIVEVKTFVFGRDIATLDDDLLLNYVERLTGAIEHLEGLNTRTPLAKLVTKIAQLKDAKAKIVDLLGGAPVPADSDGGTKGGPLVEPQPRKRRTKAEIEADAQQGGATPSAQQTQSKPVPYVEDLPEGQAQPIELKHQGPFVAIIQVDGAGPDEAIHHVLVRYDEIDAFVARLQAMKVSPGAPISG